MMATLTIRNLSDDARDKLRRLAAKHGHSMEEEVRRILRQAVQSAEMEQNSKPHTGLGTNISAIVKEIGGGTLDLPPRSHPRTSPFGKPTSGNNQR